MSDLTEFLLARIAEDEERAKRAAFGWGGSWAAEHDEANEWSTVHSQGKRDMLGSANTAPARAAVVIWPTSA